MSGTSRSSDALASSALSGSPVVLASSALSGSPAVLASSGSAGTSGVLGSSSSFGASCMFCLSSSSNPSMPVNASAAVADVANISMHSTHTVSSSDTDLFIIPGSNKVNLSSQKPLIRVIVQDAIEELRALMLFSHAFPNATIAIGFVWESLLTVADKYRPAASAIHVRLGTDDRYMSMMVRMVRCPLLFFIYDVDVLCSHELESH